MVDNPVMQTIFASVGLIFSFLGCFKVWKNDDYRDTHKTVLWFFEEGLGLAGFVISLAGFLASIPNLCKWIAEQILDELANTDLDGY